MNFGRTSERKPDSPHRNIEEIYRIKSEIENEDRIFKEELPAKHSLLQKFDEKQLKKLCAELLGSEPPIEEYFDPSDGKMKILPPHEQDYIFFIIDELRLTEIKNYAIKNGIVAVEFFRDATN